jgi:CRP/FNR family transcriptional regulator, cyclic AMP receptor protein
MSSSKEHSLAHVALFRDLAPDLRTSIERSCHWKTFEAKEVIVHFADDTRDVCFLVSGRARVMIYAASGRVVSFRDIGPGQFFGEYSAIDGKPRSASVEALEACVVGTMSAPHFTAILEKHPVAALALLRQAIAQIRELTTRVFEFSTLAVNNRIQAELLRLAGGRGEANAMVRIAPAPTHAEIANRISTHREAVTRELNRLEQIGVIRRPTAHEIVCDLNALKHLVDQDAGD